MRKIIRSQIYQLFLDKMIFLILLGLFIMDGIGIVKALYEFRLSQEVISGGKLAAGWFNTNSIFTMIVTALILSKDFFDKTICYEVLSGKSRTQIFMGRFVTALVISELLMLISCWTFPLVFTAFHGWGENLEVRGALFRTLLAALLNFKVCAEFALFTAFFRKKGFVFFMIPLSFIIPDLILNELDYMMNNGDMRKYRPLLNFFTEYSEVSISSFDKTYVKGTDGTTTEVFKAMPGDIPWLLIFTAGVGIILLAAALIKFSRKDMD